MDQESVREYCLSLPNATENVQWGNDLVFKIGGKMFTVVALDGVSTHVMSLKCTPEEFAAFVELEGVHPAPYAARYHWIALERFNVFSQKELKRLIRDSYEMVKAKLPKKILRELEELKVKTKPARKSAR